MSEETTLQAAACPETDAERPSDDAIAEFLAQNPDFLLRGNFLTGLCPPAQNEDDGGIIDLRNLLLDKLRNEVTSLRESAQAVIRVTRGNLSIQARVHAAVLAVLAARGIDGLARTVAEELPLLLDVDVAALCFEPGTDFLPAALSPRLQPLTRGTVDRLIGPGRGVALLSKILDDGTLFGPSAPLVRSAALVRLHCGPETPEALLALGARRKGTFHPSQGTELLVFLARVVERSAALWLEQPA